MRIVRRSGGTCPPLSFPRVGPMYVYDAHKSAVYALAFAPDGGPLAAGARDGRLLLLDPAGDVVDVAHPFPGQPVTAVAFHPADGRLFVGTPNGWAPLRPVDGGWEADAPVGPGASATAFAFLDDSTIAVGYGDRVRPAGGKLELWDLRNRKRRGQPFDEPLGVKSVSACPAKRLLAWGTGSLKVSVWDTSKPDRLHLMQPKPSPSVSLNADGTLLVVAVDYGAKVYDLALKREVRALVGHKGQVSVVAFSPDGSTVATGSWDGTVRLWDAATGHERTGFAWKIGRVFSLAYAPDGLRLAAGGDAGAVVAWDVQ